jgi:hypothetical protein
MSQKLDNNSWLFLYSQITGGLIGKQVLLDSSNGVISNPTYGNGLFRATGNTSSSIPTDKLIDNFYDINVNVQQNYLTPEISISANWYGQKQTNQQILLGYMSNPNIAGTALNIINFGKLGTSLGLTETTTKYHTLLFNNNSPSASSTLIIDYYLTNLVGISVLLIGNQQSTTVNNIGNYIFQLRDNLVYDRISVEFVSNSTSRTNLVGLIKTDAPVTPENLVCFGEGSMVFTPSGEVPIQNLKQGDQVYDENLNIQTVEFIAKRTIFPSKSLNKYSIPIQIKQGQLGENIPRLDTIVSSAHLIKHNGKMVPASTLGLELEVNTPITYYNVSVSNYSTIIVNGMISETLDTSNDSKVYSKVY